MVPFSRFSAYYVNIEAAEIPIPQNFRSIAGNATATSQDEVDSHSGAKWFCEQSTVGQPEKDATAFPLATCSTHLQEPLHFPECIDEETLEPAYLGTHNWISWDNPLSRCPVGMKRIYP